MPCAEKNSLPTHRESTGSTILPLDTTFYNFFYYFKELLFVVLTTASEDLYTFLQLYTPTLRRITSISAAPHL